MSSPSNSWSYDPKEGYITNNVATEMTGYYDCIARRPGVEDQRMSFHFDVIRKFSYFYLLINTWLRSFVFVSLNFCSPLFTPFPLRTDRTI